MRSASLIGSLDDYPYSQLESTPDTIILWNSHCPADIPNQFTYQQIISIPDIVDANRQEIHDIYTSWIDRAGEYIHSGKTNIDHFTLSEDLSTWCASKIARKDNMYSSPHINHCLKLIALHLYVDTNNILTLDSHVNLSNADLLLSQVCYRKGWTRKSSAPKLMFSQHSSFTCALEATGLIISHLCRASRHLLRLYFLAQLNTVFWLFHSNTKRKAAPTHSTFITYTDASSFTSTELCNLEQDKFWGKLPNMLSKAHYPISILYIYTETKFSLKKYWTALGNIMSANKYAFNQNAEFILLDGQLTFLGFFSILRKWLQLTVKLPILSLSNSLPNLHGLNLSRVYLSDYIDSLLGLSSVRNLYFYEVFKTYYSYPDNQNQENLFYLFENLNWETAALCLSRRAKTKSQIAYAHASIRFWDLRYSCWRHPNQVHFPQPDYLCTNGPLACQILKAKKNSLRPIPVENLRHLAPNSADTPRTLAAQSLGLKKTKANRLTVLVVFDYCPIECLALAHIIKELGIPDSHSLDIKVRLHPYCTANVTVARTLGALYPLDTAPLSHSLQNADIVVAGNATTVSLEATIYARTIFLYASRTGIDFSPLYPVVPVEKFTSAHELNALISNFGDTCISQATNPQSLMYLEATLSRWFSFLSSKNVVKLFDPDSNSN